MFGRFEDAAAFPMTLLRTEGSISVLWTETLEVMFQEWQLSQGWRLEYHIADTMQVDVYR